MRASETEADDSTLPVLPVMLRCNMSFGTSRLRIRETFDASDRGAGALEIVQDHSGDATHMSAGHVDNDSERAGADGSDGDEEDLGEEVSR